MKAILTLSQGIEQYLSDLSIKNYSELTVYGYSLRLKRFSQWCDERGLSLAAEITEAHINRYRRYLHQTTYADKRLKAATQKNHLLVIKQYFRWLTKNHHIPINPTAEMQLPKTPYKITHRLLTQSEIKRFIEAIDLTSATGLRDRSIIETLYSTGLRRAELINLVIDDVEISEGMVLVRQGKGNKDRRVPIGERALYWLDQYLSEWRPQCVRNCPRSAYSDWLYLSEKGHKMLGNNLGNAIRDYKQKAGISKPGGCHLFRHAMATHMLENGADIRYIQEMLGHSNLSSTQIYTKVSNQGLKDIHRQTHPTAVVDNKDNTGEKPASVEKSFSVVQSSSNDKLH